MATVTILGKEWYETPEEEIRERAEHALEAFAERHARDRDVREFDREEWIERLIKAAT
jgi:energy-coupling factor transporter ATP-binding protein EcfA2